MLELIYTTLASNRSITRRKKCDEVAPQCGECRRLKIADCQGKSTASFRQTPLTSFPAVSEFDGDRDNLPDQDLNDVVDTAMSTSEYLSHVALMPESDIAEMARRGHLKDSNALRGQEKDQDPQNIPILKNFPRVSHWDFTDWDPVEQYLLNHFLEVVSRSFVVVFDDENPFLQEILPKASNVRSVRHALLALTACHLCKLYPNFEGSVVRHQSLALFLLKKDLESGNDIENTLVVSLLLCLFEVSRLLPLCIEIRVLIRQICQGNSRKWILHLYGSKALIDVSLSQGTGRKLSQFLLDLYKFICCKAMITCEKVPVMPSGFESLQDVEPESISSIHPLVGLAGDLYNKLSEISHLAVQRMSRHATATSAGIFTAKAAELEAYLQSWQAPKYGHNRRLFNEAVYAAEAIRWAALLRLYQVVDGCAINPEKRRIALNHVEYFISQIRPGSSLEAQLLFPLFMAGLSATRRAELLSIEYRITVLESTVGTGNITGAHKLLDLFWERSQWGSGNVDWEFLLQEKHANVVLY